MGDKNREVNNNEQINSNAHLNSNGPSNQQEQQMGKQPIYISELYWASAP